MSYKGFKHCDLYKEINDPSKVLTHRVEAPGLTQRVFKYHDKGKCDSHNNHTCDEECEDDMCERYNCCGCEECNECEKCCRESCEPPHHKECPKKIKGFDFCRKKEDIKCFKHCAPISQPCDFCKYNYFTSRANLDFSGLVVVKNTSNLTTGCSMKVCVTDKCGTDGVATVNPGSSVSIFVEELTSLDIICLSHCQEQASTGPCVGEVIFDLEYCTIKYMSNHECCDY